eukprot:CCRYP_015539-RA/>CCRYP_015539-RA protein AED:0.36 eAED:0.36 QI:15/0.66/0.75/1/0/0/4/261/71
MGDKLQIAKRPGESHKHNPHLRVGKLPYLMGDKLEIVKNPGESRKHNPHLRWAISLKLSKIQGKAINIIQG